MKYILTLLTVLFIFSCTNELVENSIENIQPEYLNENNSFDFVGIKHNSALLYAANQIDIYKSSDLELYNAISQYVRTDSFNPYSEVPYLSVLDLCPTGCDFTAYLKVAGISDFETISIYSQLQKIVFSNKRDISDLSLLLSDIKTYENELIQSGKISSLSLGTFSIIRNSLHFWYNASIDKTHPYHSWVSNIQGTKGWNSLSLAYALTDAYVYSSCMSVGAGSSYDDEERANEICIADAAFGSARAFGEI